MSFNRQQWGWIGYDWGNSPFVLCVITVLGPAYFIHLFQEAAAPYQRFVGSAIGMPLLGLTVTAEAMWSWGIGMAAAIVAFSAPLLGSWADRAALRKRLLLTYCLCGSAATLFLSVALPWWAVGLCIMIGSIGFEGGNVYYNSLLRDVAPRAQHQQLSALGYAAGYISGVLILGICLVLFVPPAGKLAHAFMLIGIWWATFGILTLLPVKEQTTRHIPSDHPFFSAATWIAPWQRLLNTLRRLRHTPHTARFLIAFLLYNDGIATLISNATPFALQNIYLDPEKTELITVQQLVLVIILIQLVAAPGALCGSWLSNRFGERPILIAAIGVFVLITVLGQYASLLSHLYGLAVLIGLVLGSSQSMSRALFASFVPPGQAAEYFGLFAWSAKFSAMLGPFIYAGLLLWTGSTRLALLSLSIFFTAGLVLLFSVNVEQARAEALARPR